MTAPLRLSSREERAGDGLPRLAEARPSDPIAAWLDVLTRMLPRRQAADVREELEDHVRARVRDLVLAGQDETAAVRAAITELGDAAAVAQRFREAGRVPTRRLVMNIAVLGVAGAALVTSLVGVMRPGEGNSQPEARALEGHSVRAGAGLSLRLGEEVLLGGRSVRGFEFQPLERAGGREPEVPALEFDDTQLGDALNFIAESAQLTLMVRWPSLGEAGFESESMLTANAPPGSLAAAFDALNGALSGSPEERALAFRVRNGVLEVARPQWFDRRESTLVRYDLQPIEDEGVSADDFMGAVMQFVSPADWQDNGGDLARQRIVGDFAFVQGPPRIHEGVRWFLAQFMEQEGRPADPGAAAPGSDEPVCVYHIQHIDAQELLKVLMNMESIREVDFTNWAADGRTNSILGKGPVAHHRMVQRAIKELDSPEAALERRVGQKNAEMRAVTQSELATREDELARLRTELHSLEERGIGEHADSVRARFKEAEDRAAEARARLLMLEHEAEESDPGRRSEAEPAVESEEASPREQALTSFVLDTLARPIQPEPFLAQTLLRRAQLQLDLQPRIDADTRIRLEPIIRFALQPEPITRALLMAHADAETVAGMLRTMVERGGEPFLSIEVDPEHNTVIVRGLRDQVLAAEEAAWKLDALAGALPAKGT